MSVQHKVHEGEKNLELQFEILKFPGHKAGCYLGEKWDIFSQFGIKIFNYNHVMLHKITVFLQKKNLEQ